MSEPTLQEQGRSLSDAYWRGHGVGYERGFAAALAAVRNRMSSYFGGEEPEGFYMDGDTFFIILNELEKENKE